MPSPFPGMDPYLEPHWLDVHSRLVTYASDGLNETLPTDLVASTEERVAVEGNADAPQHTIVPDVRIIEPLQISPQAIEGNAVGNVATLPFRLFAQSEPTTERFIKLIETDTERLVTVIEFVSPTNKLGEGLGAFRKKRAELLAAGVNFVEIDLVRAGNWRKLLEPFRTTRHISLYRVTIRLPNEVGVVQIQPISLRETLPKIPIPLRAMDPPLYLELQPLLNRAYDNGRYARRLDYSKPLDPPLDGDDAVWAEQLWTERRR